jgi:hypothetical protein
MLDWDMYPGPGAMSKYKTINLILFIALILLVRYQQYLEPWRFGQWYKVPKYQYGWAAGIVLTLAAVVACVLSILALKRKQIRLVEVFFPVLVAVGSAWVTYQLYHKWQWISIIK